VFHAQQAVEKSFKALLTWHGGPFRKTHNLEELGEQSLGVVPELGAVVELAVLLTGYAWRFRWWANLIHAAPAACSASSSAAKSAAVGGFSAAPAAIAGV
jgi:hypothetical protein